MKLGRNLSLFCLALLSLALCLWRVIPRPGLAPLRPQSPQAAAILAAAKAQIGTRYDASFVSIAYPGGDVPLDRGACTDVVVRALRGVGVDLQRLIHEDMSRAFASYPHAWSLSAPNPSIDHRRVPNQMRFLQRHAQVLPLSASGAARPTWQPGDIVYWNTGRTLHTGIVSDTRNTEGEPWVIHNGSVCREEDCLTRWTIIGHFRWKESSTKNTKGSRRITQSS